MKVATKPNVRAGDLVRVVHHTDMEIIRVVRVEGRTVCYQVVGESREGTLTLPCTNMELRVIQRQ